MCVEDVVFVILSFCLFVFCQKPAYGVVEDVERLGASEDGRGGASLKVDLLFQASDRHSQSGLITFYGWITCYVKITFYGWMVIIPSGLTMTHKDHTLGNEGGVRQSFKALFEGLKSL